MTSRDDAERLLAAVRNIGPLIREGAAEAERARRLSPAVVRALAESGLFRLLLPRSLGGLEVDPVTFSRIVEEVAAFDSAAGWALQAGNTGDWWAARLPTEGADEIYAADPSTLTAAAFHPPQQAVAADGGYRITGRGPLASNIHDAEWLFLTAVVMEGDRPRLVEGMPMMLGLVLRSREVEVQDTWYSLGMRGTDSNDVIMKGVFVPASRTFPLVPHFQPGAHHQGPLYRFPGIGAAVFALAPVALAVARGAISEVMGLTHRKTAMGFARQLRERPAVQATVARGEAMLRAARLLFYDTFGSAWERTADGGGNTLEQKADLMLAGCYAAVTAATVTDMMHKVAGSTGIYARSPIERHFRDAQTLRHHGFLSENRFENAGQVYLGLEPEFPMVVF